MRPDARPDPCHQGVHGPPANGTEASLWRGERPGGPGPGAPLGPPDAGRRGPPRRQSAATARRRQEAATMAEPILIVDGRARRPRTIREMPPEDRPRERLEARGHARHPTP